MTRQLPITVAQISNVSFYKRDEVTTDLIYCEITSNDGHWLFNEEMDGWPTLVAELETLPNFRTDWYAEVSQPPFASSRFVAYDRQMP